MESIDLEKISVAVSHKLGDDIRFVSIEKAGDGFHATGYKLLAEDGRAFFIKKITANAIGFEYPERKLSALLLGHAMARRGGGRPQPVALIVEEEGNTTVLPEISHETNIYHVQEYEPEGTNYFVLLKERLKKSALDERDHLETGHMVDIIAAVHGVRFPITEPERQRAVYMDGLRAELVHPELTLMFMHGFDESHPVLPPSKQGAFVELYLNLIHEWKGRQERLCALHGDLWGANMFIRQDGSAWAIDFSRVPWGDPGVDIGRWMGQYVWFYLLTKNPYFKELGELFLDTYSKKTGDQEIRKALSIGFVFPTMIYASFYTEDPIEIRKQMFAHGCEIMRRGEFFWPTLE